MNARFPAPRRLCQPRDLAPGVRHGVRGPRVHHPGPGHGLLPGDVGGAHPRRGGLPDGGALRELRDGQGRLRRAPRPGRHQRDRERDLPHDEHPGGGHRAELPGAGGALRSAPRLGPGGPLAGRARRAPDVADPRARFAGDGVLRTHPVAPVRDRGRGGGGAGPHLGRRAGRRGADTQQQGLVRRARRVARRLRRAGVGRLRPGRRTGTPRGFARTSPTATSPRAAPAATTARPTPKPSSGAGAGTGRRRGASGTPA